MRRLRSRSTRTPLLAALLLVAALLARLLVPAGFMPVAGKDGVTMALCSGHGPMAVTKTAGRHGSHEGGAAGRCAYADLALAAIGGADPVLLLAALRFAIALSLCAAAAIVVAHPSRLRPPLRAPPAALILR